MARAAGFGVGNEVAGRGTYRFGGGASDLEKGAGAAASSRTPAGVRLGHDSGEAARQVGRLGLRPSSVRGRFFFKLRRTKINPRKIKKI